MQKSTKKKHSFNQSLLKILICPVSKKPLHWNPKKNELISKTSGLVYPIVDDIPILIKEKAKKL